MAASDNYLRGIIEGFYGREWSWDARRRYAGYLEAMNLNAYLYCPKGDAHLRKQWQHAWPAPVQRELASLATVYREKGLHWGVGLSPFALYQDYSAAARNTLKARVAAIDSLGGDVVALLFDDMPGDIADLAARQAEIVADVRAWSRAEWLIVCPTYYSYDPVLERFFGARPEHYWDQLGRDLDPSVDVFWTGNQVCSATVSAADLAAITESLGRKPVLWDNYPVNDGAKASKFLHLTPLPGRAADLPGSLRGHFCNPMNQAELSRYPLGGLAALYGGAAPAMQELFPTAVAARLVEDQALFEQGGLEAMAADERQELAAQYAALGGDAALEVAGWLRDEYAFDPACLTG